MAEKEMNRHQRGMVDGCFEEGHYQRGIATLNQLRKENLRPSAAHVRQLIYISLYPPPPLKDPSKDRGKRREMTVVSGSPSKQIQQARRLQKQALFPPPEATQAAKELLDQLVKDSISPESLLRAVPCYPLSEAELDDSPRTLRPGTVTGNSSVVEDMDSYVAKQAVRLKECKDCWSMLRKGVVTRQDLALMQKEDPFLDIDREDEDEEADLSSAVVGKHSWDLLEWFILLFEKDQALVEDYENEEDYYSILLLSQIRPASRSGDPRSCMDSVLDIVFLCYNQNDQWRRSLGRRLMNLVSKLIALTKSKHFSPSQFLTTVSVRLQASQNDMLRLFLGDLPESTLGYMFKVAICDRYLTQSLRGASSANSSAGRTRPQARRARPLSVHVDGNRDSRSASQTSRNQAGDPQWNLPTPYRVLSLLERNSDLWARGAVSLSNLTVLFHLVTAFGILAAEYDEHMDRQWVDAVLDGELERKISENFSGDGLTENDGKVVKTMRLILSSKCNGWKQVFINS